MDNERLPEKGELVRMDLLRIQRNKEKDCKCQTPKFEVDVKNRRVYCTDCGAVFDPFDVVLAIANRHDEMNKVQEQRLKQKMEIENYKPHLRTIKYLEQQERRKKEIAPICPACAEPFLLEELTTWVSRRFADVKMALRRERNKEVGKDE